MKVALVLPMEALFDTQHSLIVYGEFRTGKTQMAHTMSVVAQLPSEYGGASGKVDFNKNG